MIGHAYGFQRFGLDVFFEFERRSRKWKWFEAFRLTEPRGIEIFIGSLHIIVEFV